MFTTNVINYDYDQSKNGPSVLDTLKPLMDNTVPEERVLLEMAKEADRLDVLMRYITKHALAAQTSNRRVQVLKTLNEALVLRDERKSNHSPVTIYAQVLRLLKEVMQEQSLSQELIETLFQGVVQKIHDNDTQEKGLITVK
jgi:predicted double-glycine peptidase